jgi:thymidylate kinase
MRAMGNETDPSMRDLSSLEHRARELQRTLRRQARRPFVLEITGTPKAGKTTLIKLVDAFLRDCGWRVYVLKERASECPLPMKGHFFFNTWTTGTMLAGLLDAVDRDHDIVILDRGIFDALIWLDRQREDSQVTEHERETFEAFVMLERWRNLVNAVCVVQVAPETAMERENTDRLLPRTGSIMNLTELERFNEALRRLQQAHPEFPVAVLDNKTQAHDGARNLLELVLCEALKWCDPEIAVIAQSDARELVPGGVLGWNDDQWTRLCRMVEYKPRSSVEDRTEWVQLLACGVQVHDGEVFLALRQAVREDSLKPRDNTARVWTGCHVERPQSGTLTLQHLERQLERRLKADLHLGDLEIRASPLGMVWDPDGPDGTHLGLMFHVPVAENVKRFLAERQFKTNGRGYPMKSSFVDPAQLAHDGPPEKGYTLEKWSHLVLLQTDWLKTA